MDLERMSSVPGRGRWRVGPLHHNNELARRLRSALGGIPAVKNARINPVIGTVTVIYESRRISPPEMERRVEEGLIRERHRINPRPLRGRLAAGYRNDRRDLECAGGRVLASGLLLLLVRLKTHLWGRSPLGSSHTLLFFSALVTIIADYPVLYRLYRTLFRPLPLAAKRLLIWIAFLLAMLRERLDTLLLLLLMNTSDFLLSLTSLRIKEVLIGSERLRPVWCSDCAERGIRNLDPGGGGVEIGGVEIGYRITEYRERALHRALIMSGIGFMVTGNLSVPLAVMLVMSPTPAVLSLRAGLCAFIHSLVRRGIYLRDAAVLERLRGWRMELTVLMVHRFGCFLSGRAAAESTGTFFTRGRVGGRNRYWSQRWWIAGLMTGMMKVPQVSGAPENPEVPRVSGAPGSPEVPQASETPERLADDLPERKPDRAMVKAPGRARERSMGRVWPRPRHRSISGAWLPTASWRGMNRTCCMRCFP